MGRLKKNKPRRERKHQILTLNKENLPEVMRVTDKTEEELLALISFREETEQPPYVVRVPR